MNAQDIFRLAARGTASRWNLLQLAASYDAAEDIEILLSRGMIDVDINEGTTEGLTPIMIGAREGYSRVVRTLLDRGADVLIADNKGCTALHFSALEGHLDVTMLLVQAGADLQARTRTGHTPLHLAAQRGHIPVVTALVGAGADLGANASLDFTPLHLAAQNGHVAGVKALVEAGADLEAKNVQGCTPLHLAAEDGHSVAMMELLKAGANPDSRSECDEETPLFYSASRGHVGAVRVLLRAKANPLFGKTMKWCGEVTVLVPIDVAAALGHVSVVQKLLQQRGIEGSAGANLGVQALGLAARHQQVGTMAVLVEAGVVDTGAALCKAARWGGEPAVKFLLERQEGNPIGAGAYVNTRDDCGATPLMCAVGGDRYSARVVRRLVDAGAETASAVRFTNTPGGKVDFDGTPLAFTNHCVRGTKVGGKDATEKQLNGLEGIRRLLLRVEAVHARSWLWHGDVPSITDAARGRREGAITSASLRMTLPVLRRRARTRGVVLAPLLRYSSGSPCRDVDSVASDEF